MEIQENRPENEEKPVMAEFSIADILDTSLNQSHDVQVMRHYLLRMMKRKNHEVRRYTHNFLYTASTNQFFPSPAILGRTP